MSVTAQSVYREAKNFFRNQFINFLLIAIFCAFITMFLNYIFLPNEDQISNLIKNGHIIGKVEFFNLLKLNSITPEQQKILLHISTAFTFSGLISNALLTGSVLLLIQLVLSEKKINVFSTIIASLIILPKLFILNFLTTALVQIGIMFLIIPGIIIASILIFAPIMIVQDKANIFVAMQNSIILAWKNMSLIVPAIISLLLAKMLLLLFTPNFIDLTSNIDTILINILSNLISEILLIYIFRLYMLVR